MSSTVRDLLAEVVADPALTGVGRLPVRPRLVPFPDPAAAATGDPTASPWWMSLDGDWEFALHRSVADLPDDEALCAAPLAERVTVPCAWTTQRLSDGERIVAPHYTNVVMPFDLDPPAVPEDNPVGVHRRRVTVPRSWASRRVVLRVGAAESALVVAVDGRVVGASTDSRLPAEFDLTDHVRPGRRATVVLVVARWSAASWLEDQDQWWHGGIQRSVTLSSTAPSHLCTVAALPGRPAPGTGRLSLDVRVEGPAVREPGWTVEAVVTGRRALSARRGRRAGTGRLEVPVWDGSSEAAQLLSGTFTEPGVVRHDLEVPDAAEWSHETPERHRVTLTLRDPAGRDVESVAWWTGFRDVAVRDRQLLVNDQPVLIHGVNLHEHDPHRGRAVPVELTRVDLTMMKAHNLNAVRAAHYPHDEHLAELCDELGLYLVDEANVESHARQASLCHDPRYGPAMVERVRRMVARDQLHPSVVVWSLGNESGDGPPHDEAAAWVRRVDPTRPVQYEGPFMFDLDADAPCSDVVCPMYPTIDAIVARAVSPADDGRPLIMCEYSHAMGNSNGSLADHWDAIESTHGLQGGFIWEWVEHGLRRDGDPVGPDGGPSWGYGGDFGDEPNDANFVCDGLVAADRTPRPALAEVHHVGRPVRTCWAGRSERRLRVENRRWFTDLSDLRAEWTLTVDGTPEDAGELDVPDVPAQGSVTVPRPCAAPTVAPGVERHLTVTWRLRRAGAWAPAGHVVAVDQLPLPVAAPSVGPARAGGSTTAARPTTARPRTATRAAGAPSGDAPAEGRLRPPGTPVLGVPWTPTAFRALTDNDGIRSGWMRGHLGQLRRWVDELGLDRAGWGSSAGAAEPPPFPMTVHTLDHGDGWTRVTTTFDVPPELADLPRLGVRVDLPAVYERWEWLGDGPGECYVDRRAAAVVGRHRLHVDDVYVDHVVPQEHGHRTGVRWLAVTGPEPGPGLLVVADPDTDAGAPAGRAGTVGATLRRHTDEQLWACRHTDELARRAATDAPRNVLMVDLAQRGLGTASCGPDTLERYRIPAGRHRLVVHLRWYDPATQDPGELAQEIRSASSPS